ncbi:serine protease [Chitinimonas sp.]|uniref:S1C family serine protease n=1 Tax=Chitinimonas sp. TaxID=1934313 RepID=UPI002F939547
MQASPRAYIRRAHSLLVVLILLPLTITAIAAESLPDLIDRVKPSIVVVGTYQKTRSPAFIMRGTGFVVGNGNQVVTNVHVVPELLDTGNGESLAIQLVSGFAGSQLRLAKSEVLDDIHDLALLKFEGDGLPPLPLNGGATAREGQAIAFIGFPIGSVLGLSPVTHRGIVSAVTPIVLPSPTAQQLNEKMIRRIKTGSFPVYQLDATAYPGNSGGPLFDLDKGEVIGIINMVFVKGTKEAVLSQPSGISFAMPSQYLQELLRSAR